MITLTVTARGQITLKSNVMSHLGIKPGDQIELQLLPDRKVMIHAVPRKPIKTLIGSLAGKTDKVATLNEINEAAAKGWSDEH